MSKKNKEIQYHNHEEALYESEAQFRGIFNSAAIGITMVNPEGRWLVVNPKFCEMLGYSESEILQHKVQDLTHPDDLEPGAAYFERYLNGEIETYSLEKRYIKKDGSTVWVHLTGSLMCDASGAPRYSIFGIQDITRRKQAEEDRDRFFDLSLDMMCIAGFDGYFKRLNPSWSKTFGFTDEELLAKPFIEFVHPDDQESTVAEASKLADIGTDTIAFENRYICKDGTYKWLSWNATTYPEQQVIYATARDITAYVESEAALRESQARYSDLFENATDMIQSVDTDGRLLYTNRSWCKVLGYSGEEIAGLTMFDIIHPDEQPHCIDMFNRVMSGEEVERIETVFVTKDGRPIDVEGDINCKLEDGKPVSTRGIFRDITERKAIDRMKTEFISTVSHELRTPLTSIHGSLGLLAGNVAGELPEQARVLIEIAYNNGDRLIRLINDILDMEKIESGKMVFNMQALDIMPLVEQTIAANRGYADRFNVKFTLTHDFSNPKVYVDSDRLIQVVTNLLSNAAKFSPENSHVEIEVTSHDEQVCIAVTDHGPGISKEFKERIFEKFAQEDASTTRQKGGTGLGLSISRAIVDHLNGKIWLDTTPDEGTTFYVELPIYKPKPVKVARQIPASLTDGSRILVCEDHVDTATILKLILTQAGFQVDIAPSASQAKQCLKERPYEAMTLDLQLPDQDGLSLLKELRMNQETVDLPIIIISANADQRREDLQSGEAVWVIDWMEKPIDSERLLETVNKAMQKQDHRPRILHVEDDEDLHYVVLTLLHEKADLTLARSLAEAKEKLEHDTFDLVLLDIQLPDGTGFEILSDLNHPPSHPTPVIVFSAQDHLQEAADHIAATLVKSRTSSQNLVQTITSVIQEHRSKSDMVDK